MEEHQPIFNKLDLSIFIACSILVALCQIRLNSAYSDINLSNENKKIRHIKELMSHNLRRTNISFLGQ